MPSSSMSKKEMQEQLLKHGEIPPSGWTKVQLKSRLIEISESEPNVMTERDASHIVNRCKTKAALQEKMDEYKLEYNSKTNCDQLRGSLIKHLMETQVPASESNFLGFGKRSSWTYAETAVHAPSYSAWAVETATNERECHWRLRRYALWYQGLSRSDKMRLEQAIPYPESGKEMMGRRGYGSNRAASSTGPASTSTETEAELIPEVSQTKRITELETELRQLKEMVMKNSDGSHSGKGKGLPKTTK